VPSRKGKPNKLNATAKENIIAVFTRMKGTAGMAKWAKEHPTEFYRIYARLLPVEMEGSLTIPVTLVFDDPTQVPDGYQRKPIDHEHH
jgi:hypothetical protein